MEIQEALNLVGAGNTTVKIVEGMLQFKTKLYDPNTGLVVNHIKDYLSIAELQAKKTSLTKKLNAVTQLLALVSL